MFTINGSPEKTEYFFLYEEDLFVEPVESTLRNFFDSKLCFHTVSAVFYNILVTFIAHSFGGFPVITNGGDVLPAFLAGVEPFRLLLLHGCILPPLYRCQMLWGGDRC